MPKDKPKLDKYTQKVLDQEKAEKAKLERIARLKDACQRMFSTEYGRLIAKDMMHFSNLYNPNKEMNNPYIMGAERGKESFYLKYIKNMLTADQLALIERTD